MIRCLGLDVGQRRIGISVSDLLGLTAQGVETFTRTDDPEKDLEHIISVAQKYAPVRIVFGLPRNMNGSYGFQAESVRDFAKALLDRHFFEHDFTDERLTTVSAERVLLEADITRKKRKQVIDKMAAVLILQSYLDSGAHERPSKNPVTEGAANGRDE